MKSTRRRVLKTIGSGSALLTGGVGAATARKRQGASAEGTLVDVASAGGFDVLVAAASEVGLDKTLSGDRQLTVFAPIDKAFNDVGITVDNVGQVDEQFLVDVLTFHVTPGRRYSESVVNPSDVQTLNGQPIETDGTVLNDGQANIVTTDIEASNGVAHAIDGVLLPESEP